MNQFEHSLIAQGLLVISWYLFIRRFFWVEAEIKSWEDYLREKFF
jgi:hypothetical protein